MTSYISRFQEHQTDKLSRGWYVHPVTQDDYGTLRIQYKTFTFSKKSRNEAMEKFAKQFVGMTRDKEVHHTGLVCVDYLFNDK